MIGLPKSSSFMPVARQRPRAPAMLRPWVVVGNDKSAWASSRVMPGLKARL